MKPRLIAVMAIIAVLAAGSAYAASTDPDTFVFVTFGEVDSLDPAYCYDTASGEIIHQLYDNLIAYKGSSLDELIPMLATEIPTVENGLASADGTVFSFPIRKDVKFHSGHVLTPEDVEYSFERAMLVDPDGGPVWMFFEPLLGVFSLRDVVKMAGGDPEFEDPSELSEEVVQKVYDLVDATVEVEGDSVVFKLANPYPPFLQILAKGGSWSSIISKEWMIANGDWDGQPTSWPKWHNPAKADMTLYAKANGTGPFKLNIWDTATGQVIFDRFDDYWQGPAKLERVVAKYVDEPATRLLLLKTGDADAALIQNMYLDQVRGVEGIVVEEHLPVIANTALIFNYSIPIEGNEDIVGSGQLDGRGIPSDFFNDVHVRKAFCMAYDYDAYIDEVALGAGSKPVGPAPSSLPYVDTTQAWYDFDLKAAAEEFKKAFDGELWEKGFQLTLLYNTGNDQRKTAAEILEFGIEQINPKFQIDVRGMEWATYLDRLRASALPVFFLGWHMDFPDAHNFYMPYLHSTGDFSGYCGDNMIAMAKEYFDDLIEAGIKTTDPEERAAIYGELQKRAKDLAASMYYIDSEDHRVYRDWVKGFVYNPAYSANYDFYSIWKEVN